MFFTRQKTEMIDASNALPGRETATPVPDRHFVLGTPLPVSYTHLTLPTTSRV